MSSWSCPRKVYTAFPQPVKSTCVKAKESGAWRTSTIKGRHIQGQVNKGEAHTFNSAGRLAALHDRTLPGNVEEATSTG